MNIHYDHMIEKNLSVKFKFNLLMLTNFKIITKLGEVIIFSLPTFFVHAIAEG